MATARSVLAVNKTRTRWRGEDGLMMVITAMTLAAAARPDTRGGGSGVGFQAGDASLS